MSFGGDALAILIVHDIIRIFRKVAYSYTSHMFNDVQNTPLLARPDVNMVDLSGSIISPSGKTTFTVGGTNVTDKPFVTTGQPQIGDGVSFGTYNAPREWSA